MPKKIKYWSEPLNFFILFFYSMVESCCLIFKKRGEFYFQICTIYCLPSNSKLREIWKENSEFWTSRILIHYYRTNSEILLKDEFWYFTIFDILLPDKFLNITTGRFLKYYYRTNSDIFIPKEFICVATGRLLRYLNQTNA